MRPSTSLVPRHEEVKIEFESTRLDGFLTVPSQAKGIVIFAHGSGSGRFSTRNQAVSTRMHESGFGTLLFDLLTEQEAHEDQMARSQFRFNITLLANRLVGATDWLTHRPECARLPFGYFGASTGAAAALIASANLQGRIHAIVSRGGRPDMAGDVLRQVKTPTLFIIGGYDKEVLALNQSAHDRLATPAKRIEIVPEAGHLFEEPGKLEEVSRLAIDWFRRYLV